MISRCGSYFYDAIDTTGVPSMDADWTFEKCKAFVLSMGGPDRVIAIVLDSPSVNTAAMRRVEEWKPKIFALRCLCHQLALFIKDVFKIDAIAELFRIVQLFSTKFRLHKFLREQLVAKQKEAAFASHHITRKDGKHIFPYGRPKIPTHHSKTRFASWMYVASRALLLCKPAAAVMMQPDYIAKFEEATVQEHGDDAQDDFVRRDTRSLSAKLSEIKSDFVLHTTNQKFIQLVLDLLQPVKAP